MMFRKDLSSLNNQSISLLVVICMMQVLLIAVPFYFHDFLSVILVLIVISGVGLFGSITLAVLYLCFIAAVIPTWVYDEILKLPLDFKFYEGVFAFIIVLSGVAWLLSGRLNWPYKTRLDRPVLLLMGMLVFSIGLGLFYGQPVSQMLRDIRYPLCYSTFFIVTWFFDYRKCQMFLYLVIGASVVVGIEYLIEFLAMVNLSVSGSFFRVARLEGVLFPIGILSIVAILLLERHFYRRVLVGLASLPIGIALLLTVGRGMWIALFVGLSALGYLVLVDPLRRKERFKRFMIVASIPFILIVFTYTFQMQTNVGVGDVAVRRIARVADNYEEDHSISGRLIVYGIALEEILKHPLFGGGHGVSIRILSTNVMPPRLETVGGVDSVYLTIAMRMGIVGVGVFLWVFCSGLWYAYKTFLSSEDEQSRLFCMVFIAVYSALLVFGIGDATLFVNRLIFVHATFLGILAKLDTEHIKQGKVA
ncbi:MAG: O-antigen ligase family protein [Candidatus Latescibacteria bacterium]|jgi:O-antigen ligase|nr:O-antigen ligase family protein [Candidatus Latescibacterota bacterium]MBT5829180.1 O-antigen ligase family protein [Candidatus Latescibacterota bacterium]